MLTTRNDQAVLAWVGRVLMIISSVREVTDAAWDDLLVTLGEAQRRSEGFEAALLFSAGAAANATQRRRLAERMKELDMKSRHICLLSNSAIVRMTVPALARLLRTGTAVASFKTSEWRSGLFWLQRHYGFDLEQGERVFIEACERAHVPGAMIGQLAA